MKKTTGIILIIIGIIGLFLPIVQGILLIAAGLLLIGVDKEQLKKRFKKIITKFK